MTIRRPEPEENNNFFNNFICFFQQASSILRRIHLLPYDSKLSDKEFVVSFVDDSVAQWLSQGAQLSHLFLTWRSDTTAAVCGQFAA